MKFKANLKIMRGSSCTSSSIRLFMNECWPLSGHERVTEARLLLILLV